MPWTGKTSSSITFPKTPGGFLSSAAVSFVSALCLILLSRLEHIRSPHPSMLLSIFLSLPLVLDIAQCRTLWLASHNTTENIFCRLCTGAVVIKAVCFALETQHKSKWMRWNDSKQHSPEDWSGFYVLGIFSWLNALLLTGYRKTLTLTDLFPLDPTLSSTTYLCPSSTASYRELPRERVIAVSQEPVFLSDSDGTYSFRDNLHVSGASPSDEDCRSALVAVGLWSLIEARGGLKVAFRADVLSQGQKQLFSLARAVLRCRARKKGSGQHLHDRSEGEEPTLGDGGVLMLDEFTSGVDRDTEIVMQKIIGVEFRAYTVLMVSHRLETIMNYDTVVVMDSGRIIGKGRPATLLSQGSRFREL